MDAIYWAAFAIPLIFIGVDGAIRKLVNKAPWHWRQFHCGIDLALAVLGAVLANFLDLAKETSVRDPRFGWNVGCTAVAVLMLLVVAGFHQDFETIQLTRPPRS